MVWAVTEVEPDDERALRAYVEVSNAVAEQVWGTADLSRTVRNVRGTLRDQDYTRKRRFVVGPAGGDPWGYLALDLPLRSNTHTGECEIGVLSEHRGQGLGSALYDRAVTTARAAGRVELILSTDQPVEPPPGPTTLSPSSGSGRVDAQDPSVRFVLTRGWSLAQVARRSVLDLPLDPGTLAAHRAGAQEHAGDDYRLVLWEGPCPEEWVEQYALLSTRMSTDEPHGDLDVEEDIWDAPRIRADEAQLADRGITILATAVEHVPTHTLAGHTILLAPEHTDEYLAQNDTIVLREHRGRRLGMLVKAANLQRVARELPGVRRIGTWNAEENAHMLAINTALGFRPAGGSGEWQRRLD